MVNPKRLFAKITSIVGLLLLLGSLIAFILIFVGFSCGDYYFYGYGNCITNPIQSGIFICNNPTSNYCFCTAVYESRTQYQCFSKEAVQNNVAYSPKALAAFIVLFIFFVIFFTLSLVEEFKGEPFGAKFYAGNNVIFNKTGGGSSTPSNKNKPAPKPASMVDGNNQTQQPAQQNQQQPPQQQQPQQQQQTQQPTHQSYAYQEPTQQSNEAVPEQQQEEIIEEQQESSYNNA